jgi:hypothetical protein
MPPSRPTKRTRRPRTAEPSAPAGAPTSFAGDPEDLARFLDLASSPIRSDERERALEAWSRYKLAKQARHVGAREGRKGGVWRKGDYIRSLTAPAIDLRGAVLRDVCLGYADLRGVRFDGATFVADRGWTGLKGVQLCNASLQNVDLTGARLMGADLRYADLRNAKLGGADLADADLCRADLRGADLRGANLERARLVGADLRGADICRSRVYGVAAWDVEIDDDTSLRRDLVVTPGDQPDVTVDNIEVAQFVYLLLGNPKIRTVLDTICRKGVLILGRFTAERKPVLDALRSELRRRDFVPIVFDFERSGERDLTETIKILAGLSVFVIADITNPKSSPLELQATVPEFMIPLVPIIADGEEPFAMFKDLWVKYRWVLEPVRYPSAERLLEEIETFVIAPALAAHEHLRAQRGRALTYRSIPARDGE